MDDNESTRAHRKMLKSDLMNVKKSIEKILIAYQNCMVSYVETIRDGYDHGQSTLDQLNELHKYAKKKTLKKVVMKLIGFLDFYSKICLNCVDLMKILYKFQFEEHLNAIDDELASYFRRKMDNHMEAKYSFFKEAIHQEQEYDYKVLKTNISIRLY